MDYWPNAIAYVQSKNLKRTHYVIYPAKNGFVHILHFEEDCLQAKRSFKIIHSVHHRITTVYAVHSNHNSPSSPVSVFFGYENNVIDHYHLNEGEDSIASMIRLEQVHLQVAKKQPVINIKLHGKIVIAALPYQISFIDGLIANR